MSASGSTSPGRRRAGRRAYDAAEEGTIADYSFVTIWRLRAPIERVFEALDDPLRWPSWWPSVPEVVELEPNGPDGVGGRYRFTFKGRLPYLLRFDSTVTRRERPTGLEGAAEGELEGTGRWNLSEADGWTTARYDWNVATTRWWMNLLAPLPFVAPIFRLNHHAVMRDGLQGIRGLLGVEGTYERLD